jgi:ribose transport system ATP-binding protein
MPEATMLRVAGVSKSYAGNPVLKNIDLELEPGKAHALVGENGAGKSTLVKIISGGILSYEGKLELEGRPYRPSSPSNAQSLGVVAVQQELSLSPYLPVYQNLWLGKGGVGGLLSGKAELRRKSQELLDRYGMSMELGRWVADLSLEEQQLVEILKAVAFDPKVVIFDEPTSALGAVNTRWFLDLIADLKGRGRAVLLISHRLPEVMELADAITVLKDGSKVATVDRGDVQEQDVVRLMVGRDLTEVFPRKLSRDELAARETLLEVRDLCAKGVDGVSFSIRSGEVVGLAGLEGQGQHDLLLALFGVNAYVSGEVRIAGGESAVRRPSEAIRRGIGLVPVDRRTEGVVLPLSISENVALASLSRRQRWGWVDRGKERNVVQRTISDLGIHSTGPAAALVTLSGGNQQKVVLGKWLATDPRVLLMDDPTRGVDIETRRDIYRKIREIAARGVAILVNSTDALELVGLCDRVLVMFEGRLARELTGEAITEEAIVGAAVGVKGESHAA